MWSTLVALALQASPESMSAADALEALSKYGALPECRAQETIEGNEMDNTHRFSPPRPVLAGKVEAKDLIPYTRHPDRRVMTRAVQLLCFEGSGAAKETIQGLAQRWPCEREVLDAAWALGVRVTDTCQGEGRWWDHKPLLFAPAKDIYGWSEVSDSKLYAALIANDAAAWKRAMEAMTYTDASRTRLVVKTLAALDTAPAIRRLFNETKGLSARVPGGELREMFAGVGTIALGQLAKRLKLEPSGALLEVIRSADAADIAVLDALNLPASPMLAGQGEAIAGLLQREGTTPSGRALLEQLQQRLSPSSQTKKYFDRQHQLEEWERFRDRPALRAYVKDASLAHADRRAAAMVLAKLGDASGLELWASREGLAEEEVRNRRNDLTRLMAETGGGPVYAAAKKLYDSIWAP